MFQSAKVRLSDLGLTNVKGYELRELWDKKDYGVLLPSQKIKIHALPPMDSMLFKATIVQ